MNFIYSIIPRISAAILIPTYHMIGRHCKHNDRDRSLLARSFRMRRDNARGSVINTAGTVKPGHGIGSAVRGGKPEYLEGQKEMSQVAYGRTTMAYAGCEVIAAYNALLGLGVRQVELSELIRYFNRHGRVLGGYLGTSPHAVATFFRKAGYSVISTTHEHSMDTIAAQGRAVVMTFYNDGSDIRKQIHTVCLTPLPEGGYQVHNLTGNGTCVVRSGPADLLKRYNKGRGKLLVLYSIS